MKKKILKDKKNWTTFFLFCFSKLPQKRCQGGRHLLCQLPQSVYEEDLAEETA
jgi:hypothetical protein